MIYTDAQKQDHIEEVLGYLYQIALHDHSIPIVMPSRKFTEEAGLAVRAYQQAHGLPVTGEIDGATWDSIVKTYHEEMDTTQPLVIFPGHSFALHKGDSGTIVQLIQVLLNISATHFKNLHTVTVTGVYDDATYQAVWRLQEIALIDPCGSINCPTWNCLASLINHTSW